MDKSNMAAACEYDKKMIKKKRNKYTPPFAQHLANHLQTTATNKQQHYKANMGWHSRA